MAGQIVQDPSSAVTLLAQNLPKASTAKPQPKSHIATLIAPLAPAKKPAYALAEATPPPAPWTGSTCSARTCWSPRS